MKDSYGTYDGRRDEPPYEQEQIGSTGIHAAEFEIQRLRARCAELVQERDELKSQIAALMPQPCCRKFETCERRCVPLVRELRGRIGALEYERDELKRLRSIEDFNL